MARDFARGFYTSKEWRQTSRAFMQSKRYVCERCGGAGEICHHKIYLNPRNITNPYITLNWDNLECLCQECHNKEHMLKRDICLFNEAGEVERVKECASTTDYKEQSKRIDELLSQLKGNTEAAQDGAQ